MRVLLLLFALVAFCYATVTPQELEAARVNCANRCRHNGQIEVRCMQACWAEFFKDRHGTTPKRSTVRTPRVIQTDSLSPSANFRQLLEARRKLRMDKEAEMILEKALHLVPARGAPPVITAPSSAGRIVATLIGITAIVVVFL
jgi:hypothetical protein